jgi:hypothetical protein
MTELPTKEELVHEVKVKIESEYQAMLTKLEKRAQQIKSDGKKRVDEALSQVKFGPSER